MFEKKKLLGDISSGSLGAKIVPISTEEEKQMNE
jgi:hypothetical protein